MIKTMCHRRANHRISPFLRLFFSYYGKATIRLEVIHLRQWRSWISLLWNIAMCVNMYSFVFGDEHDHGSYGQDSTFINIQSWEAESVENQSRSTNETVQITMKDLIQRRPFLDLFTRLTIKYFYPSVYIGNSIFSILSNLRCVTKNPVKIIKIKPNHEGDHDEQHNDKYLGDIDESKDDLPHMMNAIFAGKSISVKIFFAIVVIDHAAYSLTYSIVWDRFPAPPSASAAYRIFHFVRRYIAYYALNLNIEIFVALFHCYKYLTLCALRKIRQQLSSLSVDTTTSTKIPVSFSPQIDENEQRFVCAELRRLSALNRKIEHRLSFSFLNIIAFHLIDVTLVVSAWAVFARTSLESLLYTGQFLLHTLRLICIGQMIENELQKIADHFQHQSPSYRRQSNGQINANVTQRTFFWCKKLQIKNDKIYRANYDRKAAKARSLQTLKAIQIYSPYLRLRFFNLFNLDWRNAFVLALLVLNYVILISQTSI